MIRCVDVDVNMEVEVEVDDTQYLLLQQCEKQDSIPLSSIDFTSGYATLCYAMAMP